MGSGIKFISQVLNQKGAPALYEDIIDNRPAATFEGRLFFVTDVTNGDTIFRDNGDGTWSALAGNGGGGTAEATNGLTVYDGTAVGLGGTLSQPTTIIYGDTRVWQTDSSGYTQGFDLNFDGEIYQFGILSNVNDRVLYTRFENANIITLAADENSLYELQVTHSEFNYYLTYTFDYYDGNTYSF